MPADSSDLFDACNAAVSRPVEELKTSTIAFCAILVRPQYICVNPSHGKVNDRHLPAMNIVVLSPDSDNPPFHLVLIPPQTFAFVVCAAASGRMFWHWKRLDGPDRDSVWKHYGWFCGLMCSGCCVGAISYLAWAMFLVNYYATREDTSFWTSVRNMRQFARLWHLSCV